MKTHNLRSSAFIRVRKIFLFFSLLLSIFLISCTKSPSAKIPELPNLTHTRTILGEYAKEFRIDEYAAGSSDILNAREEPYKLLTISDSDRYLLVPENAPVPENLPSDVKTIRFPLKNVYLAATSTMAFFARLDSLDSLGFSSIQKKDWYIEEAVRAMENGSIQYAGKYSAPDFELLIDKKCPLAIESMMISHSPQIKEKLELLGITVFVDKSSYEEHPLGRLEWIKVYGLLTGKFTEAEQFFDEQTHLLAVDCFDRKEGGNDNPIVAFFYTTPSGMAVIRGSDDYIVKMIEMAGGTYAFPSTKKAKSPSIQISMEQFYAHCADADILIYNSSIDNTIRSREDLIQKNPLFAECKAVENDAVWATGSYIYQATDRISDVILDLQKIIDGRGEEVHFLQKVE
ncbi:MAG: ABC transporter substrate-binding protein [Treponema sp.]|nr:ABC transporter substrate-binding protein [Treponema sp.]